MNGVVRRSKTQRNKWPAMTLKVVHPWPYVCIHSLSSMLWGRLKKKQNKNISDITLSFSRAWENLTITTHVLPFVTPLWEQRLTLSFLSPQETTFLFAQAWIIRESQCFSLGSSLILIAFYLFIFQAIFIYLFHVYLFSYRNFLMAWLNSFKKPGQHP